MILESARAAIRLLPTIQFRAVLIKTIGLTLLMLAALWFGLQELVSYLAQPWLDSLVPGLPEWAGWFGVVGAIVFGIGLALALALLIAPVTAIVAGIFLDDIAAVVEQEDFPADPPGKPMPVFRSMVLAVKFFGVVLLGNIVALVLLLVPGINVAAFFLVNGYLIGREFFEFAAMRHIGEREARLLRQRHYLTVFLAGLIIAAFLWIPVINLATPLFAAAMMVHLFKHLRGKASA
jgi:CysZ protein